ncbi:capsular polysaccharide synthesis protein [Ignatzschineria larvae DSM 13226]|uniref:Capsular polysaccharide synthesis protein n=1 Tax=Ignatzschineria larvae DSM 13226 TaxID=1111732 RepID=A0ABZ3C180_9GAMM|nr:capsular polysaccharide synthesis protein [Ignatzschineria larvae]
MDQLTETSFINSNHSLRFNTMHQKISSISPDLFSDSENSPKPFKENKFKRAIYKMLFPKEKREAMSLEANQNLALRTAKNWRYMINQYFLGNLNYFNVKAKKDLGTEKIIWQYWGQGLNDKTLPPIAKASFNSVDKYKGEYLVIRLDDQNISDYLEFPDFVWEKKGKNNFRHVFFSDLLRLALLDAYGGVWIDATIILTSPIPADILNKDFFVFQRDPNTTDKEGWYQFSPSYFCWESYHLVNILSSFMVAKKNNEIVHLWLDLLLNYWQTQRSIYHYHFFQILFEELMVNDLYAKRGEIIDDTLPHLLHRKMHAPFNEEEFKIMTEACFAHKLTYVKNPKNDSFYAEILRRYS